MPSFQNLLLLRLTLLKLCYWKTSPPSCHCITFHDYLKCASTRTAKVPGAGPGTVPTASQQKQLCQTQLAASEGKHLFPQ